MTWYIFVELIIFSCISNLANVFVFYPIILWIFSKIFSNPLNIQKGFTPEITVIIAAYNEEKYIKDAILSLFETGYPIHLIKVIVGSDGSTDNTVGVVNSLVEKYPSIQILELPRSGKNAVLNKIVPLATTDIIFYMDADVRITVGTFERMIEKFTDSSVGAVQPYLIHIGSSYGGNAGTAGDNLYLKYESTIRVFESNIDSAINAVGAFYGIRRELYKPIPNDSVCDDYYMLLAILSKRKRVIFDNHSIVYEVREKAIDAEIIRRLRTVAGGLASILEFKELLLPRYKWVSFFLWTHKITRWITPIFIIGIVLGSIVLPWSNPAKSTLFIAQALFFGMTILGWVFDKLKIKLLPFQAVLFFVSMNIGFLLGIFRFLMKTQNAKWERIDTTLNQ